MTKNKGVSLIEILVALFILALIVGPFTGMFLQSTRIRNIASNQLKTIYTVRNEMEILMSKDAEGAYNSAGVKNVDDLYIRTSVVPYSAKTGTQCFYLTAKSLGKQGDAITVLAPDGYRSFLLEGDDGSYTVDINIDGWSYTIKVGSRSISGQFRASDKSHIQINLIDKQSSNHLDFNVVGNADVVVYPGSCTCWNLICDSEYTVINQCFYRDYSILKVKIEAFEDASLYPLIYEIENIIRTRN